MRCADGLWVLGLALFSTLISCQKKDATSTACDNGSTSHQPVLACVYSLQLPRPLLLLPWAQQGLRPVS